MQHLFANIISEMYGPHFLLLYIIFIVLVIFGIRYQMRRHTGQDEKPNPKDIPADPDPYAIAFLRGETEVIKLGLMRLLGMKMIKTNQNGAMLAPTRRKQVGLTPFERAIMNHLRSEQLSRVLLTSKALHQQVENHFGALRDEYEAAGYMSSISGASMKAIKTIGAALIVALGLYKLVVAIMTGHFNVFLILLFGGIGVAIAFAQRKPRLTHAGKKYLKSLKTAYGAVPTRMTGKESYDQATLAAATAGFGVLLIGDWATVGNVFTHGKSLSPISNSNTDGYTCGVGCGGSCGGGCGGGCGGCGS